MRPRADSTTTDLRVAGIRPLVPAICLMEELPCTEKISKLVNNTRQDVRKIVSGSDDRLVVVVGPSSMHDPKAALEFASKLKAKAAALDSDLLILMKVFFEKPRSGAHWKGMIYDPYLDESFDINHGMRTARQLLLDVNAMGLPTACEFLDTISPQFTADLVSWGFISGRTTESQVHRELASGLSMPVGFENGVGGEVQAAVEAAASSCQPHNFLGVSKQGIPGLVQTTGNQECHIILCGGPKGPNFSEKAIHAACSRLADHTLAASVMVDCSHANSSHVHTNQPDVAAQVADMVAMGSEEVMGIMLDSFLLSSRQDIVPGKPLLHGVSVTDACIDWSMTDELLDKLAEAVRRRRTSVRRKLASIPSLEPMKTPFPEVKTLTDNLRIRNVRPLMPPACLLEQLPCDERVAKVVLEARQAVQRLASGQDDRLMVVLGPSSIHERTAAVEYAARLRTVAKNLEKELHVVMRVSCETPDTPGVAWQGLINDPEFDGTCHINLGFRTCRQLLLDINRLGLPTAGEFLDTISPQFLADLTTWARFGTRNAPSQVHRELASGLSCPVGFENGSGSNVTLAADAVEASSVAHHFLGMSNQGLAGIVQTTGNRDCHVFLSGDRCAPAHLANFAEEAAALLTERKLPAFMMVDCSGSQPETQAAAVGAVADVVASGSRHIFGVQLHSFLVEGRQDMVVGQQLQHGCSVTKPCLGWDATVAALEGLAAAVVARRKVEVRTADKEACVKQPLPKRPRLQPQSSLVL